MDGQEPITPDMDLEQRFSFWILMNRYKSREQEGGLAHAWKELGMLSSETLDIYDFTFREELRYRVPQACQRISTQEGPIPKDDARTVLEDALAGPGKEDILTSFDETFPDDRVHEISLYLFGIAADGRGVYNFKLPDHLP